MMRLIFLIVTAFWGASLVFLLYYIREMDKIAGFFIFGAATFCLAVCAILERLKMIETLLEKENSKQREMHQLGVGQTEPIPARDAFRQPKSVVHDE